MQWLRRKLIAGFFVMVPLVISVAALVWVFRAVDGSMAPLFERLLGREVPGLGLLTTIVIVFVAGVIGTNVIGRRILQQTEHYLLLVPVFRHIYAPIKQLIAAFSPGNEASFKRVVLVDAPGRGAVLGFLTREFTVDYQDGRGPQPLVAIYVPTNHLYLGDIFVFRPEEIAFPDITVEQGIRIFLTGGTALPPRLTTKAKD
jgi:uncharacterized membrane protein